MARSDRTRRCSRRGTPVLLRDVATLQIGGEMRRGVGELDGVGEAVGGVVIARFGENAFKVIADAKAKLAELEDGLPPGVFVKTTYDRSALIDRSVGTLRNAVIEELIVIALISSSSSATSAARSSPSSCCRSGCSSRSS